MTVESRGPIHNGRQVGRGVHLDARKEVGVGIEIGGVETIVRYMMLGRPHARKDRRPTGTAHSWLPGSAQSFETGTARVNQAVEFRGIGLGQRIGPDAVQANNENPLAAERTWGRVPGAEFLTQTLSMAHHQSLPAWWRRNFRVRVLSVPGGGSSKDSARFRASPELTS